MKYPTQIQQKNIGNKLFVLEVIRDLDEAIDLICDSMSESEKRDPFAEDLCPYFGILWPAATALAEFLSENQILIKNKTVLELGCGLGLPSMVATHLGAEVLATDFHPDVEEYFLRNCRHTNITCKYQRLNWRETEEELPKFDIVMGSDILYESKHPRDVASGLIRFLRPHGKIILSDPGRNYLDTFVQAMHSCGYKEELVPYKNVFVFIFTEC